MPTLGASGAIAGVLGGYILLFPRARVVTVIFIVFFFTILELPALLVLGIWFLQQALFGYFDLAQPAGGGGGVAYFAHIGGFVFGLLAVRLFSSRKRVDRQTEPGARPALMPAASVIAGVAAAGDRRRPAHAYLLATTGATAPVVSDRARRRPARCRTPATAPLAGGGTAPSPLAVRLDLPGDPVSIKFKKPPQLGAAVRPRHRPRAVPPRSDRRSCRSPR